MADFLNESAKRWPESVALSGDSMTFTYRQLNAEVEARSIGLAERPLILADDDEWSLTLSMLAGLRAGRTVCCLNTRQPSTVQQELRDRAERFTPFQDGPGIILFTSGSSSTPKAVRLPLTGLLTNACASAEVLPLGAGDRWLLSLPLYHVAGIGIVLRCLMGGACVVLCGGEDFSSSVAKVSHLSLVPTQLSRLIDSGIGLTHLRAILLGGASASAALIEDVVRLGLPVHTTWGMTETGAQFTTTRDSSAAALASSGQALRGRELRISDDGEIEVRGEGLFEGYEGGPRRSADSWFATGDLGHVDEAGRLHVTGRRDLQFVCGGENIQPEAIEQALLSLPAVAAAVVVPIADKEFGHRPAAFISAAEWQPEVWIESLRKVLPGYMIPRHLALWPEGEVIRSKIRRERFLNLSKRTDFAHIRD